MGYVVTAEAVQVKRTDGSYVHLYKDAPIPPDIDEDTLIHLVDSDLVAEVKASKKDEPEDDRPAKNASTDEWRAYAISKGENAESVGKLSRDELANAYYPAS